jgi:hypothetical protein
LREDLSRYLEQRGAAVLPLARSARDPAVLLDAHTSHRS